jgi:AcrR family transcriptional regulator
MNLRVDGKAGTPRKYNSEGRKEAAHATRAAILEAARTVFLDRGYVGTSMSAVAEIANVALDTIYAVAGKKPELLRLVVETAISDEVDTVPAEQRDYVRAIRATPRAVTKLKLYAGAIAAIQPRLAPVFKILKAAAPLDAGLTALWQGISERRAANMKLLARDLAATGELRKSLSVSQVADILWSMNSPEYYLMLVEERQWSKETFERWLADAWIRLLLKNPSQEESP